MAMIPDPDDLVAMEPYQRQALNKSRVFLISNLTLANIEDDLLAKNIFSEVMMEYILAQKTKSEKIRRLLTDLVRRPKSCYRKFIELLRDKGEAHCAEEICKQEAEAWEEEKRRQALRLRPLRGASSSSAPPPTQSVQGIPRQPPAAVSHVQALPTGMPPPQHPFSTLSSSSSQPSSSTSVISSPSASSVFTTVSQETAYEERSELTTNLSESYSSEQRPFPPSAAAQQPAHGSASEGRIDNGNSTREVAGNDFELMDIDDDDDDNFDLTTADEDRLLERSAPAPAAVASQPQRSTALSLTSPQSTSSISSTSSYESVRSRNERSVYKHDSSPRGLALIINNKNFLCLENRDGTDLDCHRLQDMLQRLGYEVTTKQDLTANEMKKEIETFAKQPFLNNVDSCVVAILSHGGNGDIIFGTDGTFVGSEEYNYIRVQDIKNSLNSQNCSALKRKPKLLIVQACRGEDEDRSLSAPLGGTAASGGVRPDKPVLDRGEPQTSQAPAGRQHPSMADFFIAYPACAGYVAYRHIRNGSPFIKALTETFTAHAADMHVLDMITEVNRTLAEEFAHPEGFLTMSSNEHQLLRQWYLNPPPPSM